MTLPVNSDLFRLISAAAAPAWRKLLTAAVVAGFANAAMLAVINQGAALDGGDGTTRLLLLFILLVALYVPAQKVLLVEVVEEIEKALEAYRNRLVRHLARARFLELEEVGRSQVYALISADTQVVSQAAPALAFGLQSAILVVFAAGYLATLSKAAFLIVAVITGGGLLIYLPRAHRARAAIEAAGESEGRFFSLLSQVLDGFCEVKLHPPRAAELIEALAQASAASKSSKTDAQVQFAFLNIFSNAVFMTMMAAVVFLLPRFSNTFSGVLLMATATILFLMGPISAVVGIYPLYATAQIASKRLVGLDERIVAIAEAEQAAELANGSFESLRLAGASFAYREADGSESFRIGPIDLEVDRGECLVLTGGNGSGKSTLVHLMCGLFRPSEGTVSVDGAVITEGELERLRGLYSTVFTSFHLFDRFYGLDPDPQTVTEAIHAYELADKTGYDAEGRRFLGTDLSAGQRKRLALIAAELEGRPILLLDEWAAEQDPEFRRRFYTEVLPRLKAQGKTLIIVSHDDRYYGEPVFDRVVKMEHGRIVAGPGGGAE